MNTENILSQSGSLQLRAVADVLEHKGISSLYASYACKDTSSELALKLGLRTVAYDDRLAKWNG